MTALIWAASEDRDKAASILIEAGADLNIKNKVSIIPMKYNNNYQIK